MAAFADLGDLAPQTIWERITARSLHGETLTLSVVELEPGAVVAEHRHEHEQLGIVVRGVMSFRVGDERRELGPGGTWCIPSNMAHEATAGPEGAVVIDVFAPARDDWRALDTAATRAPVWP
jgi:quercetin dioxygenase-like cupin family protein